MLLHPNHYLFTSARHSLSQLYGRDERYLLGSLSTEQLERKATICRELLTVVNVVEPGLTRLRGNVDGFYTLTRHSITVVVLIGVTLYEMHAPILLLARKRFESGECTSQELKEKVEEVLSMLMEANRILSLEDPASSEGAMGSAAAQALDQIQRWIASI